MNVLNSKAAVTVGAVLAGGVLLYFVGRKLFGSLGDAAAKVGAAVNPLSDQNIFYSSVNAIGSAVSGGDESWTLGGAIYDLLHPFDPNTPPKRTSIGLPVRPEDRPTGLR